MINIKWNQSLPPKNKYIIRWHKLWGCPVTVKFNDKYAPCCWINKTRDNSWPEDAFIPNLWLEEMENPLSENNKCERPHLISNPDVTNLVELTESILTNMISGDWHEDNDDNVYIAEEVWKMLYGQEIFNWFKSVNK